MIVSVLRNTNSSVKFWFIENFLSPSFLVSASTALLCRVLTRDPGIHTTHGGRIRIPVRVGDLQMAVVAQGTKRKAADHMGLQNPLPRCPLPDGPQKGDLCGR